MRLEDMSAMRDGAVVEWRDEEEQEDMEFEEIVDEAPAAAPVARGGDGESSTVEAAAGPCAVSGGGGSVGAGGSVATGPMKVFLKLGEVTKRVRLEGAPSRQELLERFRGKFELGGGAVPAGGLYVVSCIGCSVGCSWHCCDVVDDSVCVGRTTRTMWSR